MRFPFKRACFAPLLSCALLILPLGLRAQDATQTHTRPRRVTPTSPDKPAEEVNSLVPADEFVRVTSEPLVRVGLTTSARSVTISTTGQLLNVSDPNSPPAPFEVARLRVESRSLPPLPTQSPASGDVAFKAEVAPNRRPPHRDGLSTNTTEGTTNKEALASDVAYQSGARGGIKLTALAGAATRAAVLYAPGSTKPLLDARAPVVFSSDDPEQHPVRFNEKAYRGRLEVFPNTRGALTVVNVVPLEDYVRGVVPNELSPGGYPALEALKAQAVAARTYALSNVGRFRAEGFDLVPDTRSQVYGGRSTEHPLTDRAVAETRGRVATYDGKPINALYTSTCGGRTEDAEKIFGGNAVPYLRARSCSLESKNSFAPFAVRTSRDLPNIKSAEHSTSARDAALLAAHGFLLPSRVNDDWLAAPLTLEELRSLLDKVASLARQPSPPLTSEATRAGGFCTALSNALDGGGKGATLLNAADVEYLLSFRDADEVAEKNRADVAMLLREGVIGLLPDGTLRPRQNVSRARALQSVAHALEARNLFRLQKATARPSSNGALVLKPASGKGSERSLSVAPDAYLLRAFGEALYPVREVYIVGGEPLTFHTNARGEVDYLEVQPAPNGASADRFSSLTNWTEVLTPADAMSRLSRSAKGVGTLLDLRVARRGDSGRVLDLEVVGTGGTAHVLGGRIRSALGLREQLFVIERSFDDAGRVTRFVFTGRGWGHGVGMCQVGAYGLARAGLTYDKILKTYYTGIAVSKLY